MFQNVVYPSNQGKKKILLICIFTSENIYRITTIKTIYYWSSQYKKIKTKIVLRKN